MTKSTTSAFTCAAFLLLFSDTASSDEVYVELAPGVSILSNSDISISGNFLGEPFTLSGDADFGAGYVIGGAFGYRWRERIRVEANFSYREADLDELIVQVEGEAVTQDGGDASTLAIMANTYYDFALKGRITPYLGAGIGVGIAEVDGDLGDDSSMEFTWNVMLGFSYAVGEMVDLSVGYRYMGMTDPEFDDSLPYLGSGTLEAEVSHHEILFAVRYYF